MQTDPLVADPCVLDELDGVARRALAAGREGMPLFVTSNELLVLWKVFETCPELFDEALLRAGHGGEGREPRINVKVRLVSAESVPAGGK
jgi:hypothetical protein